MKVSTRCYAARSLRSTAEGEGVVSEICPSIAIHATYSSQSDASRNKGVNQTVPRASNDVFLSKIKFERTNDDSAGSDPSKDRKGRADVLA